MLEFESKDALLRQDKKQGSLRDQSPNSRFSKIWLDIENLNTTGVIEIPYKDNGRLPKNTSNMSV